MATGTLSNMACMVAKQWEGQDLHHLCQKSLTRVKKLVPAVPHLQKKAANQMQDHQDRRLPRVQAQCKITSRPNLLEDSHSKEQAEEHLSTKP